MALAPRAPKGGAPIERGITAFARGSNGGLIVLGTPLAAPHRELIYALAARHRLPTVYSLRFYVTAGGLISYGPDIIDPHRRAAHPQRRETGRSAGTGSDQVSAGGQP